MDWVPMAFYGDLIQVLPESTGYIILYPIPDFAAGTQEFLVEQSDEMNLFLERVVGKIQCFSNSEDIGAVEWCLMPLGVNYEDTSVLLPYTVDWRERSSEWCNVRWWQRRSYRLEVASPAVSYPQTIDVPYWTHVDFQPRQLMGSKLNQWPVLAVHNPSETVTVILYHTLRALWK